MLRTSRLRRCASASIEAAAARCSSGVHATSGSIRLPAVARIAASGVRRSCETESSRADLRASPWRATSAAVASAANRSRTTDWPSWSAAAARSRLWDRPGNGSPRVRVAHTEPVVSTPAWIGTRKTATASSRARDRSGDGSWLRAHAGWPSAEVSWRIQRDETVGRGSVGELSATTCSSWIDGPSPTQTRAISASRARRAAMSGAASRADAALAMPRLMANIARASDVRSSASRRRCSCSALSRPMAMATTRKSSRSSHSSGAAIEKVYSGWTKR
jgi:hypothetical protein